MIGDSDAAAGRCALREGQVVADGDLYPVGTRLTVREHKLLVVANTTEPYSLINRAVLFTSNEAFRKADGELEAPYALLVGGPDAQQRAERLVAAAGVRTQTEVVSPARLRSENSRFWAGNGTPLLLVVIALSSSFCGVALYAARRALQEREQVILGTLQALGLRPDQVSLVDLLRALLATGVAAVAAWPVAAVIVSFTNAGMLGFHAPVTVSMPVAAAGLIVLANVVGTGVLWLRISRRSVTESLAA